MLCAGALVGLAALWVDGWPLGASAPVADDVEADTFLRALVPSNLAVQASYLSYYALAFFVLRWWRLADPRRAQRLSLLPVLVAGFWGWLLLLPVWPYPARGVVVLIMAALIVQLVAPWVGRPPVPPRNVRLRYA
jgi:hypothetical protein